MTLHGFFHCSCIHESGFALVSLHRTKKGALAAMIRHKREAFEIHRSRDATRIHMDRDYWRWYRWQNPLSDQAWRVDAVEVQEC